MSLNPLDQFGVLIKILKIGGSWPDKNFARYQIFLAAIVHFLLLDLATVLTFVKVISSGGLEDMSEAVNMFLTYFMVLVKSINVIWKINDILELFETIESLMSRMEIDKDPKFEAQLRKTQKIFKVYYGTAIVSVFFSVIQPFFTGTLAVKMWFPYDAEGDMISLYLTAVFQMFSSIHNCSVCIALDMLPVYFMSYAVGLIDVLCCNLENIGSHNPNDKLHGRFAFDQGKNTQILIKLVEVHIRIKRIIFNIQDIFSSVLMAQGIMSVIILCTTSFSMSVVSLRKFQFLVPNEIQLYKI